MNLWRSTKLNVQTTQLHLPTDTRFANDWLEERNRFDEAARNPTVEAAFLRYAGSISL